MATLDTVLVARSETTLRGGLAKIPGLYGIIVPLPLIQRLEAGDTHTYQLTTDTHSAGPTFQCLRDHAGTFHALSKRDLALVLNPNALGGQRPLQLSAADSGPWTMMAILPNNGLLVLLGGADGAQGWQLLQEAQANLHGWYSARNQPYPLPHWCVAYLPMTVPVEAMGVLWTGPLEPLEVAAPYHCYTAGAPRRLIDGAWLINDPHSHISDLHPPILSSKDELGGEDADPPAVYAEDDDKSGDLAGFQNFQQGMGALIAADGSMGPSLFSYALQAVMGYLVTGVIHKGLDHALGSSFLTRQKHLSSQGVFESSRVLVGAHPVKTASIDLCGAVSSALDAKVTTIMGTTFGPLTSGFLNLTGVYMRWAPTVVLFFSVLVLLLLVEDLFQDSDSKLSQLVKDSKVMAFLQILQEKGLPATPQVGCVVLLIVVPALCLGVPWAMSGAASAMACGLIWATNGAILRDVKRLGPGIMNALAKLQGSGEAVPITHTGVFATLDTDGSGLLPVVAVVAQLLLVTGVVSRMVKSWNNQEYFKCMVWAIGPLLILLALPRFLRVSGARTIPRLAHLAMKKATGSDDNSVETLLPTAL